jgi:fatty acid-binding protein DegV
MVELADITDEDPIYISHADCEDDAKDLAEMVKKSFPNNKLVMEYIGPVIGSHSGCGTVALFFKAKRRVDK